jgi:hypothetical protein
VAGFGGYEFSCSLFVRGRVVCFGRSHPPILEHRHDGALANCLNSGVDIPSILKGRSAHGAGHYRGLACSRCCGWLAS